MESSNVSTLYLFCGKIAAGKSTLARRLAEQPKRLLVSEDLWTSSLFPDQLITINDYDRLSDRLRAAMGPHIVEILRNGLSVVLDFPANTLESREWMRSIISKAQVAHELHFIDARDMVCKQRLQERNAAGKHPFQTSEADFDLFTSYFVPPRPAEGFNIVVHIP